MKFWENQNGSAKRDTGLSCDDPGARDRSLMKRRRKLRKAPKDLKVGGSDSTTSKRIIVWTGIIFGLIGAVVAVLTYADSQQKAALTRKVEIQKYLTEAADIIGGKEGATFAFLDPEANNQNPVDNINRLELARRNIEKALTLDSSNSEALGLMGIYMQMSGKPEEAIKFHREAIKTNSKNVMSYNGMGIALYQLGRADEGVEIYRKAIGIDPDYAPLYYNLGMALRALGRNEESIKAYQAAIERDPYHWAAYTNLATLFHDLNRHEEAIGAFRKAVEINPKRGFIYGLFGRTLIAQGNLKEAELVLRKRLDLNPKDLDAYSDLANILGKQGKLTEAHNLCTKVIELEPTSPSGHYCLGIFLAVQDDLVSAEEELRKSIQFDNKFLPAHVNLVALLLEQGKKQEAKSWWIKADELKRNGEWSDWAHRNMLMIDMVHNLLEKNN